MRVTFTVEVPDSVFEGSEDLEWVGYEIDDKLRSEYGEDVEYSVFYRVINEESE